MTTSVSQLGRPLRRNQRMVGVMPMTMKSASKIGLSTPAAYFMPKTTMTAQAKPTRSLSGPLDAACPSSGGESEVTGAETSGGAGSAGTDAAGAGSDGAETDAGAWARPSSPDDLAFLLVLAVSFP